MPAAVIGAAATLGAAYLQHRSANNATKAQLASGQAGIDYQKSRDSIGDQRYAAAWDDYQKRHAAWEQRNFGTTPVPAGKQVSGGSSGADSAVLPDMGAMQGQSLAPGDVGGWNDWNRYLRGGQNAV